MDFENVYDSMTHNYSSIEKILGDLYTYLQTNPNDELARDMLERLGSIAENMIFSQREFVKGYASSSFKYELLNNLDSKAAALKEANIDSRAKFR